MRICEWKGRISMTANFVTVKNWLPDFGIVMANGVNGLPEKFMGTFKLDRSENFEEFLASKGLNWFLRKMISFASVTKVFSRSDEIKDAYNLRNQSSKKDTIYKNWKLNEEFQAEGFDGKIHKIKFDFDPTTESLKETHIRADDSNDHGETYIYTVDGDTLVLVIMLIRFIIVTIALSAVLAKVEAQSVTSDTDSKVLPEEFLGTFKLERDENFDEYLEAKGYGWFMRQIIKLTSITKIFRKADSQKPYHYDMESLTSRKNALFADWTLGEEFIAEALDSIQRKITFDLKEPDNVLTEMHVKVDDPNDIEIYEYSRDGDYLIIV
uniref:FABP domain-containing protein n=1 Tax=Elaeophora elaphi TaxID=1147741 RepID=A0A0R3RWM5_9BILA